mmetsp:Transcript_40105/g.119442  ORF Transcript_40105/g.119442 Transcript_40105/m.119442 type:complete len:486 (-) Transcript_40105:305-1762(-)
MTSQYRGVTYSKKSQKWQAAINNAGTHVHLGTHVSEMDAAVAFDKAALCIRGDRAKINFPMSNYTDPEGNLIIDEVIAAKLASHEKVPGAKKRKRALSAGNTPGGYGQPWPFGMGEGTDATLLMALQQMGPHAMDTYLAQLNMASMQKPDDGPWNNAHDIMTHVVPEGRTLREVVPHPASRCAGVLYDEPVPTEGMDGEVHPAVEGGAVQVVGAIWNGSMVLYQQVCPNDALARDFVIQVMDQLAQPAAPEEQMAQPQMDMGQAQALMQLLGMANATGAAPGAAPAAMSGWPATAGAGAALPSPPQLGINGSIAPVPNAAADSTAAQAYDPNTADLSAALAAVAAQQPGGGMNPSGDMNAMMALLSAVSSAAGTNMSSITNTMSTMAEGMPAGDAAAMPGAGITFDAGQVPVLEVKAEDGIDNGEATVAGTDASSNPAPEANAEVQPAQGAEVAVVGTGGDEAGQPSNSVQPAPSALPLFQGGAQ